MPNNNYKKLPKAIFFHTDYRPLIRDAHHHVLDEQTQLAPHLMPPPFLVDSEGNPYPPVLQRLVPGREHLKDDQLVPTVVVNANGEPEILGGPEVAPPAGEAAAQMPPPAPPAAQPTRSNIDQMIAQLAQQQERQRNRPRSSSSSSSSVPTVSSPPPSSDHVYSSRAPPPPRPVSNNLSAPAAEEEPNEVIVSTEATASESLPGFRRRIVVKALTPGQLTACRSYREACAEDEIRNFYEEVQRRSPNIFANSTSSPGITALLAARAKGVSDDGWAPSRPGNSRPSRPTPRQRDSTVSTPSRRYPPVSPGRRAREQPSAPSSSQSSTQHSYGTRHSGRRSDRQERARRHSRRVVQRAADSSGEEEVDVEDTRRTSGSENEEEGPRTRARGRPQRNGEALSTSDSDESESELASDLLDSDSDSEAAASSSSSSSEYSDWTADAGVNLEPPRRPRRKVYRRPVLPASEDDEEPAPSTSAAPANGAAETAEGSAALAPPSATKKKRATVPKAGPGGLDTIPEIFRPSEWLAEVIPKKSPFYPQMGDEVIYFRQGTAVGRLH